MKLKLAASWITPNQRLVLVVSLFIMLTGNYTFLSRAADIYFADSGQDQGYCPADPDCCWYIAEKIGSLHNLHCPCQSPSQQQQNCD